jgi:alcohol dehydrogenase (cytochrome c)
LNAKTGDVVWRKKIADYKAGYSNTAAPLIVNGEVRVITGNSGGEFGIVGEVQARNPENGELVWTRPTIEGHMGTLNGKESTMTGTTLNETWPGDMWKNGGGATWLGGTYDPGTKLPIFGTGNPAPWNSTCATGRQQVDRPPHRLGIDPENGEIKWHFQTTPHDGWDFDGVNEVVPSTWTRTADQEAGATADRNGFFYVLDRTRRQVHLTPGAVREEHHLGQGHRRERPPDL